MAVTCALPGRVAILLASLAAIVLGGCQQLAGPEPAHGWTVRADNSTFGIDVVVRYTSSQAPTYRLLPWGSSGFVQSGAGSRDPDAVLAILDPVSCRVVSMVDPIADDHIWVSLSIGGTPLVGVRDLDEQGDPSDPRQWLSETDTCAKADPAATPKPAPSMVAGEWLERWEMYCVAAANDAFGVRGEFLDGAVEGCEAHPADIGQGAIDAPHGLAIWNPEGDTTRLGVAWEDVACTTGATVSLYPTFTGYRAHVIATSTACGAAMKPYAVVFFLTEPMEASLVRGEVERITE
jgi:hypothetical protein